MDLKERFYKLLQPYASIEEVETLWKLLYSKYTESHRKYHNLHHLEELFGHYDNYQGSIEQKEVVCLGIFYHDIVYDIWKKDNEEKSAVNAVEVLQNINFPTGEIAVVEDLILCTKSHTALTPDQGFMIDFDLAILGQSESIYTTYTEQIRNEYRLVPNMMYRKGRKKVLQHFLDKESIYQTAIFKSQFETQARINLTNELKQLQHGSK